MPQQAAQLSEVNQVLNAKIQKRTMKLAQINRALQAEIRVRQHRKRALAIEEPP
jgi:C4-dicarboxylate-specific signal transduction histidine kinase